MRFRGDEERPIAARHRLRPLCARPVKRDATIAETKQALVVEPVHQTREFISALLTSEGLEVAQVETGIAAVEAAAVLAPEIVVLELDLPELDGVEVCRRIRRSSGAYILVLTTRSHEEDTLAAFKAGADDYLRKPCWVPELLARVRALRRRPRPIISDPE
jgi:DNA-binding response OmpR family regulator